MPPCSVKSPRDLKGALKSELKDRDGISVEIITGVERRRRWRPEEKRRVLAELELPGASVAEVARRHDISRGLLWSWRRQARRGEVPDAGTGFLPMRIAPEASRLCRCVASILRRLLTIQSRSGFRMARSSELEQMSVRRLCAGCWRLYADDPDSVWCARLANDGRHRYAARHERACAPCSGRASAGILTLEISMCSAASAAT